MPSSFWRIKNKLLSLAILLIFEMYPIGAFSTFKLQGQTFLIKFMIHSLIPGFISDDCFSFYSPLLSAFKKQVVDIFYS